MEKKLSDYLHLYLPVSVELDNGGSKVYNRVAVAMGNMDDDYRYVTLRMGKGMNSHTHSILQQEFHRIKPLLRPLSDIENDEMVAIANISDSFPYGWERDARSYYVQKTEHPNEGIEIVVNKRYAIRITLTNEIYFVDYNKKNGAIYLPKTVEIVRYLLSKHFDLFDLIPSSLALDIKNIK